MNYNNFLAFYFHIGICDNPVTSKDPEVSSERLLTSKQFSSVVALLQPYRKEIEDWLKAYPSDRMFFDDYCYSAPIPNKEEIQARTVIDNFLRTNG
jgi:hypothetical protein